MPDSLELLLDTITNVFGGILFLAMLVVVLLQTTSPAVQADSTVHHREPWELAAELDVLKEKLRPLKSRRLLTESLTDQLASPKLRTTLQELEVMRGQNDALEEANDALTVAAAKHAEQLQEVEGVGGQLDRDLSAAASALAELNRELQEERAARKMKASFPEERAASGSPFNVTIRYGRLYVDLESDGSPNLSDFTVLESDGAYVVVTPKPFAGEPIAKDGRVTPAVDAILNRLSSQREYVDVSIWDDSYEAFQPFRDRLIESGFEYRLIAVSDGDSVTYGSVANPMVQ